MARLTVQQLLTTENDDAATLLRQLRSSIAYVKNDNRGYHGVTHNEAAWTSVMARLGRGRAGHYGWNSTIWSGWNRTTFEDWCESNGITLVAHGRATLLVDTNA